MKHAHKIIRSIAGFEGQQVFHNASSEEVKLNSYIRAHHIIWMLFLSTDTVKINHMFI